MMLAGTAIRVIMVTIRMTFQSAFVIMLALTRALVGVTKIQRKYQLVVTESSALWSIRALIDSAETAVETSSGTRAPTLTRGIDLRGVSVNYDGQQVLERLVLVVSFDAAGLVETTRTYDLADGQTIDPVDRVTPTEGREISILQQLLGNLGKFPSQ